MNADTRAIPRVVLYASAPLERPALTLAGTRRRWVALLLLTLAVGASLAVVAGRAVAYRGPDAPAVEQQRVGILELELPVHPDTLGTDAGLITTPAGDL